MNLYLEFSKQLNQIRPQPGTTDSEPEDKSIPKIPQPMIIRPKVREFVCVTAHPTGCEANVKEQIDYVKGHPSVGEGPKNVLVIGASTG